MGPTDTTVLRKLRAEELESLLRGLPAAVLQQAVEAALEQLDGLNRETLAVALDFTPRTAGGALEPEALLASTLAVLPRLTQSGQDGLAVVALATASTAALGADLDAN